MFVFSFSLYCRRIHLETSPTKNKYCPIISSSEADDLRFVWVCNNRFRFFFFFSASKSYSVSSTQSHSPSVYNV